MLNKLLNFAATKVFVPDGTTWNVSLFIYDEMGGSPACAIFLSDFPIGIHKNGERDLLFAGIIFNRFNFFPDIDGKNNEIFFFIFFMYFC